MRARLFYVGLPLLALLGCQDTPPPSPLQPADIPAAFAEQAPAGAAPL